MEVIETKEVKYSKAFKETYIIINDLAEELYFKIPQSFITLIKKNMNQKYNVTLEEINKNGALPETKAILSLIYRDFLCDKDTKERLLRQDKLEIEKENEKYNDIFENKEQKMKTSTSNQLMIIEEDKWFKKVLNKIRNLFKKH